MFNSIDDFEFALDARTAISLDKITNTIRASQGELELESNAISVAKERLSKIVSKSPETSSGISMRLKSIDSAIFSKDNDWRDIIIALNSDESVELCKFKQIALKKYLRYLSNRQGMIKSVQHELEKVHGSGNKIEDTFSSIQLETSSRNLKENPDPAVISAEPGMESMLKGEAVLIDIKEGDKIELLLEKYKCELIVRDGVKLIDCTEVEHAIKPGKSTLGRGRDCTVRFTAAMREISRLHLLIVNHENKKLELTDVSTHGTCFRHITS